MDRDDFRIMSRGGVTWLESASLAGLPWLVHAFSTRLTGEPSSQRLRDAVQARTADTVSAPGPGLDPGSHPEAGEREKRAGVEENRQRFFKQVGAKDFSLAALRQTHSAQVFQVGRGAAGAPEYRPPDCPGAGEVRDSGTEAAAGGPNSASPAPGEGSAPAGDALLTNQPGILLSVRVADCVPILVADPRRRAIAAVHAGWRGSLERIVEKAVGEMHRVFESDPADLLAAIGPSIRACCYEVGPEVVDAFRSRFEASEEFFEARPPGHDLDCTLAGHLDLVAVARHQLRSAELRASNIHVAQFCTACRTDLFYSHRKECGHTGRMTAVIGMRGSESLGH